LGRSCALRISSPDQGIWIAQNSVYFWDHPDSCDSVLDFPVFHTLLSIQIEEKRKPAQRLNAAGAGNFLPESDKHFLDVRFDYACH
jgi:hypothetical protein